MITSDKFCMLTMYRIGKYLPFICSELAAFNITGYLLYFCLWQKTISSCQYTLECSSLFHILSIVSSFYCSLKESVPNFVRETLYCWLFLSLSLKYPILLSFFWSLMTVTVTRKLWLSIYVILRYFLYTPSWPLHFLTF